MKRLLSVLILVITVMLSSCSTTKNMSAVERDGSSFENAIVVKSISEEYVYVRDQCAGCELKSQALTFEKEKPYDILYMLNSSGKEVAYYFDISKFYGKMY